MLAARQSNAPADKWCGTKGDLRYERRHGHKNTNHAVEAKRERRRKLHGGDKLRNKPGHRLRNARKARKSELAAISGRQGAATRKPKKTFEGPESDLKRRKDEIKSTHDAEKAAVRGKYAERDRKLGERRSQCVAGARDGGSDSCMDG